MGYEAHNALVTAGPLGQILLFISLFETVIGVPALQATMRGERAAGDFNFGMTFAPTDPAKFKLKQLSELKVDALKVIARRGNA